MLRRIFIATAIAPIRAYQKFLSPLKMRPTCRFAPTCSCYAIEAIEKRGVVVGLAKACWRLLRCNPFSRGGYDPVDRGYDAVDRGYDAVDRGLVDHGERGLHPALVGKEE